MFEAQFVKDLRAKGFREVYNNGYYHYNSKITHVARSFSHIYYNKEIKGILIHYEINFENDRDDTVNYVLAIKPVVSASLYFNLILNNENDIDKVKAIAGIEIQNEAKTTAGRLIAGKLTNADTLVASFEELSKLGKFLPKWLIKPKMFVLSTDAHFCEKLEDFKRGDALRLMSDFYSAINTENFKTLQAIKKTHKDFVDPYGFKVHPGVGTHQAY